MVRVLYFQRNYENERFLGGIIRMYSRMVRYSPLGIRGLCVRKTDKG